MFRLLRALRRLLALTALVTVAAALATALYAYHHRDRIIQQFIREANKTLPVPVQVRAVQINTLKSFPRIALVLQDVAVKDPAQDAPYVAATNVRCAFDVWKLFHGQYALEYVALEQGQIDLGVLLAYPVQASGAAAKDTSLVIDLQKFVLSDVDIVYGSHAVFAHQLQVQLRGNNERMRADLQGQVTARALAWAPQLGLQATVSYDGQQQTLTLQTAKLQHADAHITAQGNWHLHAGPNALGKLHLQGHHITPQTLGHHHWPDPLQGRLSFDACLLQGQPLALQGHFAVDDGAIVTPHLTEPIRLQTVRGTLHLPDVLDLRTGRLRTDDVTGCVAEQQLTGSLVLEDFVQSRLRATARGQVDLAAVAPLLVQAPVNDLAGQLTLDCALQTTLGAELPTVTGTLQVQQGQGRLTDAQQLWTDVTGKVVLQDQAWEIPTLTGSWGPSTFALSGTVHPDALAARAKLYADYLDVDALLGDDDEGKAAEKPTWQLIPLPCRSLTLDCDIQQLHYRRFRGKNVQGRLRLQGTRLVAEKLQWGMAGGKVMLQGAVAARASGWDVRTKAQFRKVDLSKLFYVCENFHQNFLTDQHLRGQAFADCSLRWQLDHGGNVCWKTLQADLDIRLRQGILHHFPPLQQLAKYAPQEDLKEVHFPTLKNRLQIQKGTIHIPPMELHSSVKRMQLSGTHSLDGKINYRLVVPLSGQGLEGINLFLKLQGDVNDYSVTFDTQGLADALQDDLQAQGHALQQLLQGTYRRKAKVQELAPDDYFDFE